MDFNKLNPLLREELERLMANRSKGSLKVVIQCVGEISTPEGLVAGKREDYIKRKAKEIQWPVIKGLKQLGIHKSNIRSIRSSKEVFAWLTVDQVYKATGLEKIRSIRLF